MSRVKQILSFFLILVLVITAVGCGGAKPNETGTPATSPGTSANNNPNSGTTGGNDAKPFNVKGDITVWYSGDAESRVALYEWAKAEIEKEYPGTNVILEVIPMAELSTRQMTACQSGNGPDVMSQSNAVTNGFMKLGLLEPVQEYMTRLGRDLLNEFNPSFFDLMREGDNLYGVPQSRTALALVYNKDMFKEAGITKAPETWEEVKEAARKLTKVGPDGTTLVYGFGLPGKNGSHVWFRMLPEIWGCGGDICDPQMKTATLNTDAVKKALEYYTSFYFEGLSPKSMLENDQTATSQMFASGTVAMTIENVSWIKNNVLDKNLFDVGVAMYPGLNSTNTAGLGGWNACIPASAKNKEGAAVFIDKVTGVEGMKKQLLMPALAEVLEAGEWSGEFFGPYSTMLAEHSKDFMPLDNTAAAQNIIMNMVQYVISGAATVDEAVQAANEELQALLDAQNN